MKSRPTFPSLHFIDPKGTEVDKPLEWLPAYIELPVSEIEGTRCIYQQTKSLPIRKIIIDNKACVIAEWPWSGPGFYHLACYQDDVLIAEKTITVLSRKIENDDFLWMLEDLDKRLPASIALALQRLGAFSGLQFLEPSLCTFAQDVARIRRAVRGSNSRHGLLTILANLSREPYYALQSKQAWIPSHAARRPNPAYIRYALTRPGNLDLDGQPVHLLDSRVEHTFDTQENRFVHTYCLLVNMYIKRVFNIFNDMSKTDLKSKQAVFDEVKILKQEFENALRHTHFLQHLSLAEQLPVHPSTVLLKHPWYRAALEGYLDFCKSPTVSFKSPELEAPLQNLPRLYQAWGTLLVYLALLRKGSEMGFHIAKQQLAIPEKHGFHIRLLPDGQPVLILKHREFDIEVRLIPERKYRRGKSALYSLSNEQKPDIALEVWRAGKPLRIYLFDPKYKWESRKKSGSTILQPEKEDVDKMHVYRDAIREGNYSYVVEYAAILYPGPTENFAPGIEALQAYPNDVAVKTLENYLSSILAQALRP